MKFVVYPRIHMGLISMHEGGPRKHGGVGFSINGPAAEVEVSEATRLQVKDVRKYPFSDSELARLSSVLSVVTAELGLERSVSIEISGDMRSHIGLGSGTGVRLACVEGLLQANGSRLPAQDIIRLSGRGGTSGVGINSYFSGGLVCDLGVPATGPGFFPSSAGRVFAQPLKLANLHMPDWNLAICIPAGIASLTPNEEHAFFEMHTPLPREASYEAAYHAVFGVLAAVSEQDYGAFCRAVHAMQDTAWKSAEWNAYGTALFAVRTRLMELGADCVGLSSLGPVMYVFGSPEALERIEWHAEQVACKVIKTTVRNCGRQICH